MTSISDAPAQPHHPLANGSGAHHAQRLAVKLVNEPAGPAALPDVPVIVHYLPRHGQSQRQGVFGHVGRAVGRRVGNGDAQPFGGRQVNVVNARAPHRQNLQLRAAGQHGLGELHRRPDVDDGIGPADAGDGVGVIGRPVEMPSSIPGQPPRPVLVGRPGQHRRLIIGDHQQGKGYGIGHESPRWCYFVDPDVGLTVRGLSCGLIPQAVRQDLQDVLGLLVGILALGLDSLGHHLQAEGA
jgi:hypothetical protein